MESVYVFERRAWTAGMSGKQFSSRTRLFSSVPRKTDPERRDAGAGSRRTASRLYWRTDQMADRHPNDAKKMQLGYRRFIIP